jgi:predicted DNA-binding transcriptional regulator AlpA
MAYLNREEALQKLSHFGVKSVSGLNRLIREQGLPARYMSPRKVYFDENDIDLWMARKTETIVMANYTQAKIIEYQHRRKKRNENKPPKEGAVFTASSKAKQAEIKPVMVKEA